MCHINEEYEKATAFGGKFRKTTDLIPYFWEYHTKAVQIIL